MRTIVTAIAVFATVAGLSWLTVDANSPTVWSPYSFAVLACAWSSERYVGGASIVVGLVIVPIICVVWCLPIFKGQSAVPLRSLVLTTLLLGLSVVNAAVGYDYGVRWQGQHYVNGVLMLSIVFWLGIAALAWVAWRNPNPKLNLAFHTALFGWLAWYSLPYFGELP